MEVHEYIGEDNATEVAEAQGSKPHGIGSAEGVENALGIDVQGSIREDSVTGVHEQEPRGTQPKGVDDEDSVITALRGKVEKCDAEVSMAASYEDKEPLITVTTDLASTKSVMIVAQAMYLGLSSVLLTFGQRTGLRLLAGKGLRC